MIEAKDIVEKVLDSLIDNGISEIKNGLIERDRKKILKSSCVSFAKHTHIVHEYPTLDYIDEQSDIYIFDESDLDPTKNINDLVSILSPFVKKCFVSEEEVEWESIIECFALYYKKRALITTQLWEISGQLENVDRNLEERFNNIQNILDEIKEKDYRDKVKRQHIFSQYLQTKINDLIYTLVNNIYYLVFKEGAVVEESEDPFAGICSLMRDRIKDHDKELNDVNYWNNTIRVMIGPDERLNPIYKNIYPSDFIRIIKSQIESKLSEVLKYERMLPDSLFYAIMELDNRINCDPIWHNIDQIERSLRSVIFRSEQVNEMLVGWCNIALCLEEYYYKGNESEIR